MTPGPLSAPRHDPTPIFELFRGSFATELLAAAVSHLDVFCRLAAGPLADDELRRALGLERRPARVLLTALLAMGLLVRDGEGRITLAPLAREHLVPGGEFSVAEYVGLAARSPGVLALVERLRTDRPAGAAPEEEGAAFIYREGMRSAMEEESEARRLTLSLAGRARNVAPALAEAAGLDGARLLLDVGGGSGLHAIACLRRHPRLRAVVLDRPQVLRVAEELAREHGVAGRLELAAADMFEDPLPAGADAVLLSNVLHDWDEPECASLVARCAGALPPRGRLLIHDVFLDDDLGGPLPVALYSAALFSLTEGRAYSAREYRGWLAEAGLTPGPIVPTLVHCGLLPAVKA